MNWRFKALLQQTLSHIPLGESLNYVFQRFVTRTYPRCEREYEEVFAIAKAHLTNAQRHGVMPAADATFFEFGGGWDLLIPQSLFSLGVGRQLVVDLRRLFKRSLVSHAAGWLGTKTDSAIRRRPVLARARDDAELIASLDSRLGIRYVAPCDARASGLPSDSIDCITSTNTLEHVPPSDIRLILRECRRILKDGGIVSFRIDYQDHYSYFDPQASVYNFLRFSEGEWRLWNAGLQWQNRLRHRDYLAMIAAEGFDVVDAQMTEGSPDDLAQLQRLPLHPAFRAYTPEDLAVRNSLLVLRKRVARATSTP